jgi:tripartite-type tricarboxylate transporter receptor subunit TctC
VHAIDEVRLLAKFANVNARVDAFCNLMHLIQGVLMEEAESSATGVPSNVRQIKSRKLKWLLNFAISKHQV